MATVRRWYMFLVAAVSLQAVTWAVIALFRNLLTPGYQAPVTATAFQIAVVVVGLPIFLAHWLWAQHLAERDPEERGTALRRLYLYGMLAAFLGPFVANAFDLMTTLLWLILGQPEHPFAYFEFSPTQAMVRDLVALVVLGLLWFYHQRLLAADRQAIPETDNAASIRRLYIFGFSATGLIMTGIASINLLRWLMFQFGPGEAIGGRDDLEFSVEMARLAAGLPLWLIFWQWAQRLFNGPSEAERASALRKFYLYATIFITALAAVTNATFILAGIFRRALDLPPMGDLRDSLPIVIGAAVLWAYHAAVIWGDARVAEEAPRQAGIRRLYLYLIAAIGLAALLVGLSGDLSVLIRSLAGAPFGSSLREQLAWFTAAMVAGLPVWILPWRQAELGAEASGSAGAEERRSIVRKIYLYFYLFVATMTVLSGVVYIVYRLLSLVLGESSEGNLLSDLGQAIAFSLIAGGVWLYHGFVLRGDGQLAKGEQAKRLESLRVVVVDGEEGGFGQAILKELQRELPGLTFETVGLNPSAAAAMGGSTAPNTLTAQLAGAGLIIEPWNIALANGPASAEVVRAINASPAPKLLVPIRSEGWEWVGVERWSTEALVQQTLSAVKQIAAGEEVKPARPLNAGAIIGIIIVVFLLLIFLVGPVVTFFASTGLD
ncbi:MAG: DUF3842 family protein [Anaerolineae bacterium]|nr:DUF3842 family protein [Anaerolineae bacterium]